MPYLPSAVGSYQAATPPPNYAAAPAPVQPHIDIFTPPPGPITDYCENQLASPLYMRKMYLETPGATNEAGARMMDDKVRSTWLGCQNAYLAEHAASAAPAAVVAVPPPAPAIVPAVATTTTADDSPAPVVEQEPTAPAPEPAPADPPAPKKLTAAEKRALEEKRAAREAERAKRKEARAAKEKATSEEVDRFIHEYCGPKPEPSAWDGIYDGLKAFVKSWANDAGSVEFEGCTELEQHNPTVCWTTVCKVRTTNVIGAKVLNVVKYGKSSRGWSELKRY